MTSIAYCFLIDSAALAALRNETLGRASTCTGEIGVGRRRGLTG